MSCVNKITPAHKSTATQAMTGTEGRVRSLGYLATSITRVTLVKRMRTRTTVPNTYNVNKYSFESSRELGGKY